jgi:short-subunit dehydrogenase involved in D-alanine esterification of teichoic acids
MDITNRTVFIAGATSGIGLELGRRFAAAGSAVIVGGRRTDLLGKLAAEGFAAVPIDVTDAASIDCARDTILLTHPGLDTIVTMSRSGSPRTCAIPCTSAPRSRRSTPTSWAPSASSTRSPRT